MTNKPLGNISIKNFLANYWQKKPLLIRNAFPNFKEIIDKKALIDLSTQETQSRLIQFKNNTRDLDYGPFQKQFLKKLTGKWTLLVQDLNHHLPEARKLLDEFKFIPYARLDDLMISYATNGAGVGPHFDSYDVFLLQGHGQRLWQISKQQNHQLIPDAPLRILRNFKMEQEWILNPGDMLYLPPLYAHNGIAIGDSMTYSIGFRAPSYQNLAEEFLMYLQEKLKLEGIYQDPNLVMQKNPAEISKSMVDKVAGVLTKINYTKNDIENFLGRFLTEPKPDTYFDSPQPPLSQSAFLKKIQGRNIQLNLKTQLLFRGNTLFINGEIIKFPSDFKKQLKNLAAYRELTISESLDKETIKLLYDWYCCGYIDL